MHDLVCIKEKDFASHERTSVINKFQLAVQHLNYVDKLLVHLESFNSNPSNYILPDSVANGV